MSENKTKEKRPYVRIITRPNGYEITIDENEYMVFSFGKLMGEVFYRLGLGEYKYCDPDFVEGLMAAAAEWPKQADALKQCSNMLSMIKEKDNRILKMSQQQYRQDQKITLLRDELSKERKNAEANKIKAEKYDALAKKNIDLDFQYNQLLVAYRELRSQHDKVKRDYSSFIIEVGKKKRNIESTRKARERKKQEKKGEKT